MLDLLLPPISILALLLLAAALWRLPRASRALFALATALFTLACVPGLASLAGLPLVQAAPRFETEADDPAAFAAILVPTAGSFQDDSGGWWPTRQSIERGVAGLMLQDVFALPLILAGGQPEEQGPSQAETLRTALGLAGRDVRLETAARNSAETGPAVAAMLGAARPPRVILVTSPPHVARMSAVLRHHGVAVSVYPVPAATLEAYTDLGRLGQWLPSRKGLGRTRDVLHEYVGILWYLLRGEIGLGDLLPES